jgi:hypothetical protein
MIDAATDRMTASVFEYMPISAMLRVHVGKIETSV